MSDVCTRKDRKVINQAGKIDKITAKKNTIEQFNFHWNIGELIFESSEKHINERLEGEVSR